MNLNDGDNERIPNLTFARKRLVRLLENDGITNREVLETINSIPREQFIGDNLVCRSYENMPLPIGHGQTISQPHVVALMTDRLITKSARRNTVLEIGTGSGYQAAVLSKLYRKVYTVERIKDLCVIAGRTLCKLKIYNVELRHGDGSEGWCEDLNFDSIMITAAPGNVPHQLLKQLTSGGCLIAPVGDKFCQISLVIRNCNGTFTEEQGESVRFVPLLAGVVQ